MKQTSVLIVEDSITVRKHLVDIIKTDPFLHMVAETSHGKQAIEFCKRFKPDVISLDMVLPDFSGLAVTEYVMAYHPTPILIVSSSVNRGEVFKAYDALAAGAVEILEKYDETTQEGEWEKKFLTLLKIVSRVHVITHPRLKLESLGCLSHQGICPGEVNMPAQHKEKKLIVIGTSTGGPSAIGEILKNLPSDFPLPILLVIHINELFGTAFVDWLNTMSPIRVRYAHHGEMLPPYGLPQILVAPPNLHLRLEEGRLLLTHEAERHSCRPSIDVLFESVAKEMGERSVGCVLTGMGRDGAEGLLAIQQAGGMTLAQDESTSVVFGMPREAILLGAANHILPLSHIASWFHGVSKTARMERKKLL